MTSTALATSGEEREYITTSFVYRLLNICVQVLRSVCMLDHIVDIVLETEIQREGAMYILAVLWACLIRGCGHSLGNLHYNVFQIRRVHVALVCAEE